MRVGVQGDGPGVDQGARSDCTARQTRVGSVEHVIDRSLAGHCQLKSRRDHAAVLVEVRGGHARVQWSGSPAAQEGRTVALS